MSTISNKRIVLLFCHGGSYTKECWNPIIRRLHDAPLVQRASCEVASFDWHFHGQKRDHSVQPRIFYRDGVQSSPRVDHPLQKWPEWAPRDLLKQISLLRQEDKALKRRTHIVGIGHSMGATSLLQVETTNPGTLDGIIAFEPVYDIGAFPSDAKESVLDMLVAVSLARNGEWDTWEQVLHHMATAREFRRWDREAVEAFLTNGVEKTDDGTNKFRLVVSPTTEASVYCHEFIKFSTEKFARAQCNIVLEHAHKTPFFYPEPSRQIAEKLPGKFFINDSIANTTHSMVVEDPDACARHIVADLDKFPVIHEAVALRTCAKL